MMTGIIARAWQTVKPHVPMIKFRKGGLSASGATSTVAASPSSVSSSQSPSKGKSASQAQQLPIIEDWQLPQRYRRRQIDEREIDAINSGGAY